jgi:uncharacterized membrane protein YbhN (UPF0104 family)
VVLALSGTRTDAPTTAGEPALHTPEPSRRSQALVGAVRVAFGVVLFAAVGATVVRSWTDVHETVGRMHAYELVVAEVLVLLGLWLSALTWRIAARELGSWVRVGPASKIYLLGQLGKYLPGNFWAVAAQTALARRAGVPASRGASAGVVAIGINILTGLALGAILVPSLLHGGAARSVLLVVLLAGFAVALSPAILTRLVNTGLRIVKQPVLARRVTWGGVLSASGLSVLSWVSYGASVWVLAIAAGAAPLESLVYCVAGVALAMTVGVLVVIAPSGVGVREAVIAAALSPVLTSSDALAVALVARLVFTLADLLAALAVLPVRLGSGTRARP